ncbi:hypothetical protein CUMW_206220 [Citrus unshiu]|uniref:Uncharacterized protein n=1 Tax=Citrus unshiu TaxID=55188 RepID=A0A2H5Q8Q0_CITUN|nr:hypothetical protein CUMW_206220 [Citrus unshiu]
MISFTYNLASILGELSLAEPGALERLFGGRLVCSLLVSCMEIALVYYNEKEEADGLACPDPSQILSQLGQDITAL